MEAIISNIDTIPQLHSRLVKKLKMLCVILRTDFHKLVHYADVLRKQHQSLNIVRTLNILLSESIFIRYNKK